MPKGPFTVRMTAIDSATGCVNTDISHATTPTGTRIDFDALNRTSQYEYLQDKLYHTPSNGIYESDVSLLAFITFEDMATNYFDYARISSFELGLYVENFYMDSANRPNSISFSDSVQRMTPQQTTGASSLYRQSSVIGRGYLTGIPLNNQLWSVNYSYSTAAATLKQCIKNGVYLGLDNSYSVAADYQSISMYGARAAQNYRPYITWTWEDMRFDAPGVPTALSPANITIAGNENNVFVWNYYHSVPQYSPQTHIDLQYTANGGSTWTNIFTQNPAPNQSIVIPANTLPAGNLQWRVRTYSVDPDGGINSSAWSAAKDIIVKAAPRRPQISVLTLGPRPAFSWYVDQQEGVEIQVNKLNGDKKELVLQPRVVFGRDNQYRLPIFLPDGNYEIEIRSINSDSVWGEWGRYSFDVENIPGDAITLSTNNAPSHSIKLSWTTDDEYEEFYVLRNGIPIYKTNDKAYEDFYVNGFNSYVVRGIRGNYYTDSNASADTVKIQEAVISPIDSISWLKLEKKVGGKPTHNDTTEPDMEVVFFEGRTLPVAYTSERKSIKHDLSFTFHKREKAKFDKLREMIGKTVIYKDAMGANVVGVLGGFSASMVQNYDFNFSITETDFNEAITYD